MNRNQVVCLGMVMSICVTGQFIQIGTSNAPSWGMVRAEAGILDGILGKKSGGIGDLGDDIRKKGKEAIKGAIKKALDINVNGLNNRRADMRVHMMKAGEFLVASAYQTNLATGDPTAKYENFYRSLNNGRFETLYEVCSDADFKKETFEPGIKRLMTIEDKQRAAAAKEHMQIANNHRIWSLVYQGLAIRDATFILKETSKGFGKLTKINNLENAQQQIEQFKATFKEMSDLANDVKALCSVVGKSNKVLGAATAAYRKSNNIKDPDRKEIEKQAKAMIAR